VLCGISRYAANPDQPRSSVFSCALGPAGAGAWTRADAEADRLCPGRGAEAATGRVLRENSGMLQLAAELGFAPAPSADDDAVMDVVLELRAVGTTDPPRGSSFDTLTMGGSPSRRMERRSLCPILILRLSKDEDRTAKPA